MHQPTSFGDFLIARVISVDDGNHSKFWDAGTCESFLEKVLIHALAKEPIYIGPITFEPGSGTKTDQYGHSLEHVKILDGKNRLVSLYLFSRLCASLSRMSDSQYDQFRSRYLETDWPLSIQEDRINQLSDIADQLECSDDMDCMMEDQIGYYTSHKFSFGEDASERRFSTGVNHFSRLRVFSKTQKDPQYLVSNTLLSYDLGKVAPELLPYHYAASKVLIEESGIKTTDMHKILLNILDCVKLHVCYIPSELTYQHHQNECNRTKKGILETISLQLVSIPHAVDFTKLDSRQRAELESTETLIQESHKKIMHLLFPINPDLEYSISNDLQTEIAYMSCKFMSNESKLIASTDDQFLELFIGTIVIHAEKSIASRKDDILFDVLLKYSISELLSSVVESYLFITGCTKETHNLLGCKLPTLASFPYTDQMISLCKFLSYGKFEVLYLPCIMGFICNRNLFDTNDLRSLNRFSDLVVILTKLWVSFLIGKSQSVIIERPKIDSFESNTAISEHYKGISMRKFRDILENISREIFSCDSLKDFERVLKYMRDILIPILLPHVVAINAFFSTENRHNFTQWPHTKYLLFIYESYQDSKCPFDDPVNFGTSSMFRIEYSGIGLEHIVPKSNLSNKPNSLFLSKEYINSIGNMALATNRANSAYSTFSFQKKKTVQSPGGFGYASSIFPSLRKISQNREWSHSQIKSRCSEIASFFKQFLFNVSL